MVKFIIVWNEGKEKYEGRDMNEAENYANQKTSDEKQWRSITRIEE